MHRTRHLEYTWLSHHWGGNKKNIYTVTIFSNYCGCPWNTPSYNFGFQSSVQKKGKTPGLVPRSDVVSTLVFHTIFPCTNIFCTSPSNPPPPQQTTTRRCKSISSTEFLKENKIFHSLTAPGYPATSGLMERYVREFKDKLDKIGNTGETLQPKLDRFLLVDRITPTASVKLPFQLLMNRETRPRLD